MSLDALTPIVVFATTVARGALLETYYWDTFWVIRGLLVCSMVETAKGVIGNLLESSWHWLAGLMFIDLCMHHHASLAICRL